MPNQATLGTRTATDTGSIELIELRPQELQLIKFLRQSLKFGEVVIKVRDGLPVRLVRLQEFIDLS